jgi:cation diffusion facilitator CzcD-associated flavoprotein CzcO
MKRIAVIGGGPGGLVTLKYLTQAHMFLPVEQVQVRLFEADDAIGGTFYKRTYEDGEVGTPCFRAFTNSFGLIVLLSKCLRNI